MQMKIHAAILFCATLASCATPPEAPQTGSLLSDQLFSPPSVRINADDVFAVSPAMRHYIDTEVPRQFQGEGLQQSLFGALYRKDQLKLEYDTEKTRTASEAFDARSGNCLSLVIMTGAIAKELGLTPHYQRVVTDDIWDRRGGIYFSSGHVNLTLAKKTVDPKVKYDERRLMTVDFYPLGQFEFQHSWEVEEKTVIAMYMNNRAAETLIDGRINDAYWWARQAIIQDPRFLSTYNTLGVIYRRHGNLREAERTFDYVLDREPQNLQSLSNLVLVMNDAGRTAEAAQLTRKLREIEPYPPYYYFNLGQKAIFAGDYQEARDQFAMEFKREPTNPEVNLWLAAAYLGLGERKVAQKYLTFAIDYSNTRHEHDLYAAKLDRIKSSLQ
jgi:Tfp pilus assembly protein PilF